MKVSRIAGMMMLVLALGACSRERRDTASGSYGTGADLLTGQAWMRGGRNAGPAGVRVSVRGTGMSEILADDGQFAFASVPTEPVLDFTREADGIEATMHIEQTSGFVVIELAQSNARKSSKR